MEIETLNQALILAINEAANAAELIKGELPEVVRQLITYNLWAHLAGTAFSVVMLVVGIALIIRSIKAFYLCIENHEDPDDSFPVWVQGILGLLFTVWGSFGAYFDALVAIKILLAPKVYLLEYAANLVG